MVPPAAAGKVEELDPALHQRLRTAQVVRPAPLRSADAAPTRIEQFPDMAYQALGAQRGLRMTVGTARVGDLSLSYMADVYATSVIAEGEGRDAFCVATVLRGRMHYLASPKAEPAAGVVGLGLIGRGRPGSGVQTGDDSARLNLWLPAPPVKRRLELLLDDRLGDELEFAPVLDWSTPGGEGVRRLIRLLGEELARPTGMLAHQAGLQVFEEMLALALLQGLPHNHSARLADPVPSPAPRQVRRAEEFLRANLERRVTLEEVAAAAGCHIRSLQLAFRQWRGTTPLAAFREMRLDAAHAALARRDPELSVAEAARRLGFSHQGRFAQAYRRRYGEFPSQTVRNGRP